MRALGGLALLFLPFLIVLAWHELGAEAPWESSRIQVSDDGAVVCDGELTFWGELQGEAVVGTDDFATFSIYRRNELRPGYTYRVVDPVLSFTEPPGPGEYYPSVPPGIQIAKRLTASPDNSTVELVSAVPTNIAADPSDFELSVWGFTSLTDESEEVLRSFILKAC